MISSALAIIDGTGCWSNSKYEIEMANSFCSQLARIPGVKVRYERGPSFEGYRIRERGARAAEFLRRQRAHQLVLAGYSRGGSAAIFAARMLGAVGCYVDLLLLFDPVARHLSGDTTVIPKNVRRAWIARRNIDHPAMDKYDNTTIGLTDFAGHNPVRNWFGTTAKVAEHGVLLNECVFLGTHGALGGVGWAHVVEDHKCQDDVAKFMNEALRQNHLPQVLRSMASRVRRDG